MPKAGQILINRAPVLTLWTAVVAERLGFDREESLTLGRTLAGLNAYAKGKALGLFHPKPAELKDQRKNLKHREALRVSILHRVVPVVRTPEGLRALSKDKPIAPDSVERYLESKFGENLEAARTSMSASRSRMHPRFRTALLARPASPASKRLRRHSN